MYQHILVPVALDHEGMTAKKLDLARNMLSKGGRITLLTVLEDVPAFVTEFVDLKPENHLKDNIRSKLRSVACDADDIACEVVTGKAGVAISQFAQQHQADLIIVGSHKPGVQDYFLGSTAARVVRRAPCSVHVLREG
ncbi:MAG: universal stress protein [Pseudomonadota bacterium]